MTPPLLTELREATAASHHRLEARISIARPDVTLAEYTATVRAYLGYYAPAEARLAPVVGSVTALQWECRRKSHLLAADLACLDGAPIDQAAVARCSAVPVVEGVAQAVGLMYVLEGATLGGRYLLKTLGPQLGNSGAMSFLQGYGGATAERWKQFVDYLWTVESPVDRRQSVTVAAKTFTSFESWLEECGVLR